MKNASLLPTLLGVESNFINSTASKNSLDCKAVGVENSFNNFVVYYFCAPIGAGGKILFKELIND